MTIVDYYADWCAPCKMMNPVLQRLTDSVPGITLQKVNIDKEDVSGLGINSVPTFVFKKNNTELHRHSGAISYPKLLDLVNKYQETI